MGCGASNSAATGATGQPVSGGGGSGGGNRNTNGLIVATSVVHKTITLPKSYKHGAVITQGELNNQRTEFWTTRTDGNRLMWQAIRSAAEALLSEDVALANAIVEVGCLLRLLPYMASD